MPFTTTKVCGSFEILWQHLVNIGAVNATSAEEEQKRLEYQNTQTTSSNLSTMVTHMSEEHRIFHAEQLLENGYQVVPVLIGEDECHWIFMRDLRGIPQRETTQPSQAEMVIGIPF
jgi:hypothetical protein